jgi:8-oxo-dGTP pyrophosphatase MutT (NUDIX family)
MTERLWARMGVKGALLRGRRLLVLRRRNDLDIWPGLWDLPGGGVEKDGTLEGTLVREAFEETGFRVRVGRVLDVSLEWIPVRGEPRFPSVVSCFRCSTRSHGAPRLDPSEHTDFAWVTGKELRDLATVPPLRRAMERALRTRER